MREDKFIKRKHQGIAAPNSDNVKPSKLLIPDKYNNRIELKKLERIKNFTKALLELRDQGFSDEELITCTNIKSAVEKLIVWYKALPTYREGDAVSIEFKTGHPDMVGKWEVSDIGVQVGVTNGVAKVKSIKILGNFQTKKCQNTVVHTSA